MAASHFSQPHTAPGSPVLGPISVSPPSESHPTPANVALAQTAYQMEAALRLWLEWNEAYEDLTAQMFQAASDFARMEALADHLDQLRQQAVAASRELLG